MGCDIIMHSQIKKEGKWVWHDLNIFDDRNYTLFGILSGTRSDEFEPIAEMKGFPEDSEDKLRTDQHPYDIDNVTVSGVDLGYAGISYLSLAELESFDWHQQRRKNDPDFGLMSDGSFYTHVMAYLRACAENYGGPENVRIVFGYSV